MKRSAGGITLNFFPQGDDLPLFSGAAPRPVERPFDPQARQQQAAMFDLRLDPFHTQQEVTPRTDAAATDPTDSGA